MKFIKKHTCPVVIAWWSKIKKWYLRITGKDPDLWRKIDRLHIECEGHKATIRKQKQRIEETEKQIASMEKEFEEFRKYYLEYLQSSSDWQSRRDALSVFLAYLEAAIPVNNEEKAVIRKEYKTAAEKKGIKTLFSRFTEKKKQ